MNKIKISAILFLSLSSVACIESGPASCARAGDNAIACTSTVADCIADNGGTCKTDGPGDLELHADGTFRQEFGAYAQIGTYTETAGNLQLTSGGQIVGNVAIVAAE
jgi:hypothetical protein